MGEVRYGDRRMSYTMQPLDTRGRALNGGNHYANADTIEAAREYAARVIGTHYGATGPYVDGVSIYGQMMVFAGYAWTAVKGEGAHSEYEVIRHPEAAPLVPWMDADKRCYDTTVLDYFETVHERRSNGTCKCGHHGRWEW